MGLEVKNPPRAQSKYGLMGSSAKQEIFLSDYHRSKKYILFWVQNIKVPFGIETHQTSCICMQEGSGVINLQTELNYLDSFKTYCNSSDLGFLSSGGGAGGCEVSGVTNYSLCEIQR